MNQAQLPHRGFISVTGEDALTFLQGIITNDVTHAAGEKAVYACFLTPQGKYLADFFVYPVEGGVLLDVDKEILPDLLKRLTMYKLRSKVVLEDVSDKYSVTAVWNTIEHLHNAFADPRGINFGYRALNQEFEAEQEDYTLWQMQNGLPDVADFERERTTMAEANIDFLNGISWTKGCYMGQEITARMHYRGLVKKRFLPLEFSVEKEIASDTPITRDGKNIGFLRRVYKNRAIGVIMLEALEGGRQCEVDGIAATIHVPEWFTQL
jgi:folate-binding protein YgfZ